MDIDRCLPFAGRGYCRRVSGADALCAAVFRIVAYRVALPGLRDIPCSGFLGAVASLRGVSDESVFGASFAGCGFVGRRFAVADTPEQEILCTAHVVGLSGYRVIFFVWSASKYPMAVVRLARPNEPGVTLIPCNETGLGSQNQAG